MSVAELFPTLHELPRRDKLRVVQFLVSELAKEEGIGSFEPGASYEVWTPLEAYGAADPISKVLAQDRDTQDA